MSALIRDRYGVEVEATDETAVIVLDEAVQTLVGLEGDPVAAISAAADSGLVLARCLLAYLHCYSGSRRGYALARDVLDGTPEPSAPRERAHLAAARSWASGDLEAATRHLERALLRHRRDLLALKIAQDLYLALGDQVNLRDVAARVLPAWPAGDPAWGYVQGIWAFGLEENGDYRGAERAAVAALARNPRDVWSVHALTHVYEMEGRHEPGVSFLSGSAPDWSGSYFAVHNWWHLGLFLLELGRTGDALALYHERIRAARSTEWLDLVDAAALLWRLSLYGTDVTGLAVALAADIGDLVDVPVYLFNDWHAVMTFGLAGDHDRNQRILTANQDLTARSNRQAAQRAGLRLIEGFAAFAGGDQGTAVDRLIDIRPEAHAVGGSHAQRDVIDLTLIAAAARSGQAELARALVTERITRKPAAAASARALVRANGGRDAWLDW